MYVNIIENEMIMLLIENNRPGQLRHMEVFKNWLSKLRHFFSSLGRRAWYSGLRTISVPSVFPL